MSFTAGSSSSYFCYRGVGAASTNATVINDGACWFSGYLVGNISAAPVYLKIYDKATTPTVGTDVPAFVIMIPGNPAGSGANVEFKQGIYMSNGLSMALVTGIADSSTTAVSANEQVFNILYRKN